MVSLDRIKASLSSTYLPSQPPLSVIIISVPQVIISAGSGGRFLMRRSSSLSGALGSQPTSPNKGPIAPQRTASDSFMEPILVAANLSVYQSNPGVMQSAQATSGQAKAAKAAADAQRWVWGVSEAA